MCCISDPLRWSGNKIIISTAISKLKDKLLLKFLMFMRGGNSIFTMIREFLTTKLSSLSSPGWGAFAKLRIH